MLHTKTLIKNKAYIQYTYDTDEDGKRIMIIEDLYVDESLRRKGLGTKLVQHVLTIAKKRSADVELCAYSTNEEVSLQEIIQFYKDLGFVITEDNGDCAIMNF
jgi:ribosomal protein S18 acetylase RimI-like enzyme